MRLLGDDTPARDVEIGLNLRAGEAVADGRHADVLASAVTRRIRSRTPHTPASAAASTRSRRRRPRAVMQHDRHPVPTKAAKIVAQIHTAPGCSLNRARAWSGSRRIRSMLCQRVFVVRASAVAAQVHSARPLGRAAIGERSGCARVCPGLRAQADPRDHERDRHLGGDPEQIELPLHEAAQHRPRARASRISDRHARARRARSRSTSTAKPTSPTTPADASTSISAWGGWNAALVSVYQYRSPWPKTGESFHSAYTSREPVDALEDRVELVLRLELLDDHRDDEPDGGDDQEQDEARVSAAAAAEQRPARSRR